MFPRNPKKAPDPAKEADRQARLEAALMRQREATEAARLRDIALEKKRKRAEAKERRERRERNARTLAFREAYAALCNEHRLVVEMDGYNEVEVIRDLEPGETLTAKDWENQ